MFVDGFGEDGFGFGGCGSEWDDAVATVMVCVDAATGYCLGFVCGQIGSWVDAGTAVLGDF